MSRKKAIIILSSIWLVAFVSLVYSWLNDVSNKTDIVTAFATEDYLATNGVVEVYADYGNKYLSEDDKGKIITRLARDMIICHKLTDITSSVCISLTPSETL